MKKVMKTAGKVVFGILAAMLVGLGFIFFGVGGLCYTLGAVFYAWKSLPWSHAVWHLFVLAGSLCHFFSILFGVAL